MSEYNLQCAVVDYLNVKYPHVLYHSSLDGVKLHAGTARKVKRIQKCRGWPDLIILEPSLNYKALALEIKTDWSQIFKKNGALKASAANHHIEQAAILSKLESLGYWADFVTAECYQNEIDLYFGGYRNLVSAYNEVLTAATPEQLLKASLSHFYVWEYTQIDE